MDKIKIKSNRIKNKSENGTAKISADRKIINGNFREKLNEMIHNSGAADKLKAVEKIAENTVKLGFEKAVAHFENPGQYPLPADARNLETAVFNLLEALSKKKRNKLIDKVNEILKASSEKRKQVYGEIVNVDLRSKAPVAEQVKSMPELKKYSLAAGELDKLKKSFNGIAANFNKPLPQQDAASTTLSFFVDSMTCNNPDDILKDEVSIGGFIIDSLGNTTELAPRFIGKFRKNETVNLGANSKLFTVKIDPLLAKQSFTTSLFILESDLVENHDALNKAIFVVSLIGLTLLFVGVGIAVASVLGAAVTFEAFITTWIAGAALGIIAHYFLPLMGDDISNISSDTLLIDGKIEVGTEISRTIVIGKGFDISGTFDGKYTAAARWVGEA